MTEVQNDNYSSVNYSYMDPSNGLNRGVFTGDDLTTYITQGRDPSFLFSYQPEITEWNNIISNQQEELMELDYPSVHCSINQASQRKKRSNENKIQCVSKKEFYFDEENKSDQTISTYYSGENHYETTNAKIFTFNLKNINPLSFNKIEILFDNIDNVYTKISLGNYNNYTYERNPGIKISDFFKDKYIKDIIKNVKVNNESEVSKYSTHWLIDWNPRHLISNQKIGLTFYWENGNYYLQLLIFQYAKNYIVFPDGGGVWMGIGKGIKLYN
ncbi:MAG: hypothetical protein SPLM_09370 [Spiroplasma phoeniceum]|uniref:hypothetical protein n=1 Tax=Spiroplasma phoeniceum TaxID=47835 RepID=UPI0031341217